MKKAVLIGFLIVTLVAVWVVAEEDGESAAAVEPPPGEKGEGGKGKDKGRGKKGGKGGKKGMKDCMQKKVDSDPALADQKCSENCGRGKDKAGCPAPCNDAMKACKAERKGKKGDKSKKDKPAEEDMM